MSVLVNGEIVLYGFVGETYWDILQNADATSADQIVVNLKRRAQVVLQALVWPVGITPTQQAAALAALETRGIVARNGV